MRKLVILLLLTFGISLHAGDAATFVNLGFSSDSQYFMFGQHGVKAGSSESYAESFIIDVDKNRYAKGGKLIASWPVIPGLGADSVGALFNIVKDNSWLIKKYQIDHINTGKGIYFLAEGELPKSELEFRVFDKRSPIETISCSLKQGRETSGTSESSWFYIDLTWKTKNSVEKSIKVGHPQIKRKNTMTYFIKNVILAPDSKSLVFIIAKEVKAEKGVDLRYMVETVSLQ